MTIPSVENISSKNKSNSVDSRSHIGRCLQASSIFGSSSLLPKFQLNYSYLPLIMLKNIQSLRLCIKNSHLITDEVYKIAI